MTRRRKRLRTAGLGAAAAPLAVALVVRWGLGGAPPMASATYDEAPPHSAAPTLPTLSAEERDVLAYARATLSRPFGASPLHAAEPEPKTSVQPAAPEATVEVRSPDPTFNVSSVLVSSRGALATINGRMRREGDMLDDAWRLAHIDTDNGLLRIEGPNDRVIAVAIDHLLRK